MGVGPIVGSDPGDPELLAQAVVRKTTLSPIASLIDLIWPAVIPDLFAMGNVHSNLRVLFWRLWSCLHHTQGYSDVFPGTNLRLGNTCDHA